MSKEVRIFGCYRFWTRWESLGVGPAPESIRTEHTLKLLTHQKRPMANISTHLEQCHLTTLKGSGQFLCRGIPSFTMTKNRLFWEPGIRSRSDNFSQAGMTPWGVFGVRAAPKSMCTHQAHRLKIFVKKLRFSATAVHGTLFGPGGLLRPKIGLNVFFGP